LPSPTPVKLTIYNLAGQQIRVLVNGVQEAGFYQVGWNGRGENGELLASGVYVYRLSSDTQQETRKLLLLK
jgi:flagellar hook assembly protein FlgD